MLSAVNISAVQSPSILIPSAINTGAIAIDAAVGFIAGLLTVNLIVSLAVGHHDT